MPKSKRYRNHGTTRVAFVGNSMFYFNDFPRLFEAMANANINSGGSEEVPQVQQDSCLHGGASLPSILIEGNSMYPQFKTDNAILGQDEDGNIIYDYGACTVPQLLVGYDERIYDPGYAQPINEEEEFHKNYNPCREDPAYLKYAINTFGGDQEHNTTWDYIILNDNTRNPARSKTRAHTLQTLEQFYVPWFLESGATPVFLWTHAYANEMVAVNLTGGMEDVANFTSLTYVGYQAYVNLLKLYLPQPQQYPRIAPVGLAFLTVYEENYELWKTLFHAADHLHASPSGTFLQGCIVYHTLFGRMPYRDWVIRSDDNMPTLWQGARMMQHAWEPPNPFPAQETAEYLYRVAERIMDEGHIPKSFIHYHNGEAADA